jgi:hypothetical protein
LSSITADAEKNIKSVMENYENNTWVKIKMAESRAGEVGI